MSHVHSKVQIMKQDMKPGILGKGMFLWLTPYLVHTQRIFATVADLQSWRCNNETGRQRAYEHKNYFMLEWDSCLSFLAYVQHSLVNVGEQTFTEMGFRVKLLIAGIMSWYLFVADTVELIIRHIKNTYIDVLWRLMHWNQFSLRAQMKSFIILG